MTILGIIFWHPMIVLGLIITFTITAIVTADRDEFRRNDPKRKVLKRSKLVSANPLTSCKFQFCDLQLL